MFWKVQEGMLRPTSGELEGNLFTGAMYMWRALKIGTLKSRFPILRADFLSEISESEFDEIFCDEHGNNPLEPAKEERLKNLRQLGRILSRDWAGQFLNLVRSNEQSIVDFSIEMKNIRAFDDPLYKLTMLTAILHSGSGLVNFDDEILPAIDYHLMKQLLRQGVLVPNQQLLLKLQNNQYLTSNEAFELRRVSLLAFLEISRLSNLDGEVLDNMWWLNKQNCPSLS